MGLTKGEKGLYTLGFLAVLLTLGVKVFLGASVGNLSMNVEQLNYDINKQLKTNESLTMKVNELTSFDNVKDVVADMGLAYNNENIVVVEK